MTEKIDPASCLHPDFDTDSYEVRDDSGRLLRIDAAIHCADCGTYLQTDRHYFQRKDNT